MTINIKNRTSDWLLGHKVRLPEQKDSLFKMLKLIVKCLSCLRLKTLKTTPRSVAHTVFIRLTALGAY